MTRFVVTGFGAFCGVADNPTSRLMAWLQQQQQQAGVHIDVCECLCVSAAAVDAFLEQQQQRLLAAKPDTHEPVVLLHLGVDTQRPRLHLEAQAVNNADFRCPDEAGWQPCCCPIEGNLPGADVNARRITSLPLDKLAQQLCSAGFDCAVSQDAGKYVCNYTFWRSLQLTSALQQRLQDQERGGSGSSCRGRIVVAAATAAAPAAVAGGESSGSAPANNGSDSSEGSVGAAGVSSSSNSAASSDGSDAAWTTVAAEGAAAPGFYSLFVHVPSFDVVCEEHQRRFVMQLLKLLAAITTTGGASRSAE